MPTGTLLDDLFQAVEKAEQTAAKSSVAPQTLEEAVGSSADQPQKPGSETE